MVVMPHPPAYECGAGVGYARTLASRAQLVSFWFLVVGVACVIAGSVLSMLGPILGPAAAAVDGKETGPLDFLVRQRGLLFSVCGLALLAIGWQVVERAKSATRLAAIATKAIGLASKPAPSARESAGTDSGAVGSRAKSGPDYDRVAYEKCVEAKAMWLEGRENLNRLGAVLGSINQLESAKIASEESDASGLRGDPGARESGRKRK